jgi:small subunit ribosomal protein S7e
MASSRVVKAKGQSANEFEISVAQELQNIESSTSDLKAEVAGLTITAAREIELDGGRKAIVIFVPFRQLRDYHRIQSRLVRELEKKFRY